MPALPTRFCIIRHGETAWNTERRIQGHTDIDLNNEGLAQADRVAQWLAKLPQPLTQLYSSDLKRAWFTATQIGDACQLLPQPVPALRERRYGGFEGLTYLEAQQQFPEDYALMDQRDPSFRITGDGESLFDFFERVTQALTNLARLHPGETVGIVCHGGVLDIINRFVRGNPLHTPRDFDIPNTGINWIRYTREATPPWVIEEWGSTPHLQSAALDELPA